MACIENMEKDSYNRTNKILNLLERRSTPDTDTFSVDPRLIDVDGLPKAPFFSPFNDTHAQAAYKIFKILQGAHNFEDFIVLAESVRRIANRDLFLYVLYKAVLHHPDCMGIQMPPIEEIKPHYYFAAETIHEAIQLSIHQPDIDHIVINQSTSEWFEQDSRLEYFREDVGLNSHHWAWHVVYPSIWDENGTGIKKDRKGELFYYMHQQMLARYDCERLSNRMKRVAPLSSFVKQLEGYSPHLATETTGVHFGSRPDGLVLQDIAGTSVDDLDLWKIRIYDAIDRNFVEDVNGNRISLDNLTGIDMIGAIVEASSDSVNRRFYGNLHNMAHNLISAIHDPTSKHREHWSVMGFNETSPRDPIFYRLHKFVDNIYHRHKSTLKPYTKDELLFQGINVTGIHVLASEKNILETHTEKHQTNISKADFLNTKQKIMVEYDRLNHKPFKYVINIDNNTDTVKPTTFRIFLGPKRDEFGNDLELNEQRRLMIELDKFHKDLTLGSNVITRESIHSSVTLPPKPTFEELRTTTLKSEVSYCNCGWPDHLLIPKGTAEGMDFVLFVMCTDYIHDSPDEDASKRTCNDAISYCGSKDQKYPDTKPMGYPFDRVIEQKTFKEFLVDNMKITDVKIQYIARK